MLLEYNILLDGVEYKICFIMYYSYTVIIHLMMNRSDRNKT